MIRHILPCQTEEARLLDGTIETTGEETTVEAVEDRLPAATLDESTTTAEVEAVAAIPIPGETTTIEDQLEMCLHQEVVAVGMGETT